MQGRIVEWNHFDSSKFAACGSKLEYFEIYNDSSNKRNAKVINVREISQITCAQWYPRADRPHLMAYGCVNSVVGLLEWPHADRPGSEKILNPAAKLRKPCSGLSWNLFTPNQLASSFEKQKGDYCTVVWDIGCGQEIVKLAPDEPVSSISWIPMEPHLLALGTMQGWVKIFDIRKKNPTVDSLAAGSSHAPVEGSGGDISTPDMSITAHMINRAKSIRGIRCDPHNSHVIATFSDYLGEPVKIWDLRKVAAANTKLANQTTIVPYIAEDGQFASQSSIVDIAWSPRKQNLLGISTTQSKTVSFYDTCRPSNSNNNTAGGDPVTKSALFSISVGESVRAMSWQKCAGSMNRMLFATVSGAYVDANVLDDVPIAVSCNGLIAAATRDGKLSVSSEAPVPLINQLDGLELSSHSKLDGNCGVNSTTLSNVEEIYQEITSNWMDRDTLMKRRCTIGYGLNASKNSEILNDELDALRMIEMSVLNVRNKVSAEYTKGKVSDATTEDIRKKINAVVKECFEVLYLAKIEVIEIYRVWSWIARIEDSPDNNNIHMFNNAASLCIPLNRGGVWQLLTNMDPETGGVTTGILSNIPVGGKLPFTSECFVSAALGIPVYRSPERDMGVDLCGWIPKYFESLSKACDEKRKDVGCFAGQSSKNKSSHNISGVVSDRDEISNASIDTKSLDGVSTTSTSASDLMREISEEVENADSFERAAALAIFHGDIEVSVEILQKHIDFYVELKSAQEVTNEIGSSNECDDEAASSNEKKEMGTSPGSLDEYYGNDITNEYIQLLSLVAMCFAGYKSCTRGGSVGKNSKNTANSTWVVMCSRVLKQLCSHHNRSESIYLSAVCQFLLHTVAPDADIIARPSSLERYSNPNPLPSSLERFSIILEDTDLFIEDRIGFALVYLDDSQLAEYLQFVGKISISGMCVTGFTEDAISLLQTHIDNTQDIQTAGLLVGRYLSECKPNEFPGSPLVKPGAEAKSTTPASLAATNAVYDTREKYWFHEYRLLLNKWQFFIQRAVIDVEFAKKQRYYKQNATASVAPAAEAIVKQQAMPGRGGRGGRGPQKTVIPPRTMYCIPTLTSTPHVYLRCHYCSSSLPVDPLHKHVQADWLRRQRPMIECCPNCKKTLPRCYICRLRVGLLNPQLEFTRLQQAMRNKNMNSNHSGSNGNGSHAGNASAPPAHHNSIAIQNHSSSSNHNTLPDDSVLPMGKWLYFCQKCKHGGHASCIDQWFQSFGQYQCGVNGCSCFCQQ